MRIYLYIFVKIFSVEGLVKKYSFLIMILSLFWTGCYSYLYIPTEEVVKKDSTSSLEIVMKDSTELILDQGRSVFLKADNKKLYFRTDSLVNTLPLSDIKLIREYTFDYGKLVGLSLVTTLVIFVGLAHYLGGIGG